MVGKISLGIIIYLFLFVKQELGAAASERLWSDLSNVAQAEILLRANDLYSEESTVPMVVSTVPQEPFWENSFSNKYPVLRAPRIQMSGFIPATSHLCVKEMTNAFDEVFIKVFKVSHGWQSLNEQGAFYRPFFPAGPRRDGQKVFGFFSKISPDELKGMIDEMMNGMSDCDRHMIANIERMYGDAPSCGERCSFTYDNVLLFGLRDDETSPLPRDRFMVWLSKRELSEFVYGLCGEAGYVKLSTNSLLLPKSDVLPLETDIGKRLYFLKTHPDECDKIRSEIEKARIRLKQGM